MISDHRLTYLFQKHDPEFVALGASKDGAVPNHHRKQVIQAHGPPFAVLADLHLARE